MIRYRTPPAAEPRPDRARAADARARTVARRSLAPEAAPPREPPAARAPAVEPTPPAPQVAPPAPAEAYPAPVPAAPLTGREAWRALPLRGRLAIEYRDAGGARTRRIVSAQELRVGPGKTILGAIDPALDAYRGFRADRIERAYDVEAREGATRDVVDWLLARAERQRKAALRAAKAAASGAPPRDAPARDGEPPLTAPSPAA